MRAKRVFTMQRSCILTLILCLGILGQSNIEEHQRELKRTRKELRHTRQEIQKLKEKERHNLSRLELLSRQADLNQKLLSELTTAQELKLKEIDNLSSEIDELKRKLSSLGADLSARLVALYKYGKFRELEFLMSAKSLPELSRKYLYLRRVAQADEHLFKECEALVAQLKLRRGEMESKLEELSALKTEASAEADSLRSVQRAEEKSLRAVRTQKEAKRQLEQELALQARRLEELIARLQAQKGPRRTPKGEHFLERNRGELSWPYPGRVVANYGTQVHPKYKTKTRNNGIDISSPYGSPVRAVGPGKVVYADRFMGYGLMVLLDHGDGYYSLYSGLSRLKVGVGDLVAQGGELGESSELLHFELRQAARPVDPLKWLK